MSSPYLPDSCPDDEFAPWNHPDATDEDVRADIEAQRVDNMCKCNAIKRVHPKMKGHAMCLQGLIGVDLAKTRRELRRMDGWVPWFETAAFREAREIVEAVA